MNYPHRCPDCGHEHLPPLETVGGGQVAVTVVGTNLVIDYGSAAEANRAMDNLDRLGLDFETFAATQGAEEGPENA